MRFRRKWRVGRWRLPWHETERGLEAGIEEREYRKPATNRHSTGSPILATGGSCGRERARGDGRGGDASRRQNRRPTRRPNGTLARRRAVHPGVVGSFQFQRSGRSRFLTRTLKLSRWVSPGRLQNCPQLRRRRWSCFPNDSTAPLPKGASAFSIWR